MSKCPVCYYDCAPAIHSLTAEEAAQHFVQGRGSAQRNRELSVPIYNLWGARNCYIRRCGACEFCFADPFIAGDKTFYNLAYERSVYPADKWEFDRTLEELSRMSFRAERVLEAGAGFGFFLDKIVENRVPPIGVAALEYSDEAVKKLQSKGYFVLQQDLRNANFDQPFDAIFLFQVVEHMDDLDGLFGRISQLLRNDGLLFIAVPNAGRVAFNEQNGSLLDTPPNHIGRWSPAAFQILGSRHCLRLDWHEIEPFSLSQFIAQDVVYSYLRRSQRAGTLESFSRAHRMKRYGKLFGAVVATLSAPRRINVWRKAALSHNIGGSSLLTKFTKVP